MKVKSALDKHKDINHSLQIKHEKLLSLKHQFETLIKNLKATLIMMKLINLNSALSNMNK